jgi:hypothetical protein
MRRDYGARCRNGRIGASLRRRRTVDKVTLDDDLRAKLNGLNEEVEFCEASGETVGYYVPRQQFLRMLVDISKAQVSDEELERRANEPGGSTLAEIWKRLGVTE